MTIDPGKAAAPMVRLDHLAKSFRGRPALHDLSLEIRRGEIFGLLGHNGAGKSTTFGLMLGHLHPDAGEAFIAGHSVQRERARALSRVGAIFETPAFYEYLSGWRNLRFLVSLSGPVPDRRLREIVDLVRLGERIHDPVRTYSHGMRQRLALAQALLPDPEFVLLDEPTEGLDPEGIHEMRDLIRRLRDEHGLTVMLSSHLLSEVEQLCDRIAILHRGRLVFCGDWKSADPRWTLSVDDWTGAAAVLAAAGAVVRGPSQISLRPGADIADVVAALVAAGVKVRGVIPAGTTLEDFYLERVGS
jgi:ABC-type multidrug transport system, ATPase component